MTRIIEIDESMFMDTLINNDSLLLVDFYGTWCGPCKAIIPFLNKLSNKYPTLNIVKINTQTNNKLSTKYKVKAVPTFLLFKENSLEVCGRLEGASPERLEKLIIDNI